MSDANKLSNADENTSNDSQPKVEISMSFGEYLEELRLIERQYGQEEALYPLVYMILKDSFNNVNKDKNEKINAKYLSMLLVANARSTDKLEGRELIQGYASFPDIAIFDKEFCIGKDNQDNEKKIYGCVEMKKLGEKLLPLKDEEYELKIEYQDQLWLWPSSMKPQYKYYMSFEKSKKINVNRKSKIVEFVNGHCKIEETVENGWKEYNLSNNKMVTIDSILNRESIKFQIEVNNPMIILANTKDTQEYLIDDAGQLIGELLWYGRVIYTNGLQWKYLEVTECSGKVPKDSGTEKDTGEEETEIKSFVDLREYLYEDCVKLTVKKKKKWIPRSIWYNKIASLQDKLEIKIKCKQIGDLTDGNQIESWSSLLEELRKIDWIQKDKEIS